MLRLNEARRDDPLLRLLRDVDVNQSVIVKKDGDWLSAAVGEETVMMSAAKGRYIGLSAVGSRIWTLLETPQTLDDLCRHLSSEFEVEPVRCRVEVEAFLSELVKHGAATLAPPAIG